MIDDQAGGSLEAEDYDELTSYLSFSIVPDFSKNAYHVCYKDKTIEDLEYEIIGVKNKYTEAMEMLRNPNSIGISLYSTTKENGITQLSINELEMMKKELESNMEQIEKLKEDAAFQEEDYKKQIEDNEAVLEDALKELSSVKEMLEIKDVEISRQVFTIRELEAVNSHLKDDLYNLKSTLKKKEKAAELDKSWTEEKINKYKEQIDELERAKIEYINLEADPVLKKIKNKTSMFNNKDESFAENDSVNSRKASATLAELDVNEASDNETTTLKVSQRKSILVNNAVKTKKQKSIIILENKNDKRQSSFTEDLEYLNLLNANSFYEKVQPSNLSIHACEQFSYLVKEDCKYKRKISILQELQSVSAKRDSYISPLAIAGNNCLSKIAEELRVKYDELQNFHKSTCIRYENKILELEDKVLDLKRKYKKKECDYYKQTV